MIYFYFKKSLKCDGEFATVVTPVTLGAEDFANYGTRSRDVSSLLNRMSTRMASPSVLSGWCSAHRFTIQYFVDNTNALPEVLSQKGNAYMKQWCWLAIQRFKLHRANSFPRNLKGRGSNSSSFRWSMEWSETAFHKIGWRKALADSSAKHDSSIPQYWYQAPSVMKEWIDTVMSKVRLCQTDWGTQVVVTLGVKRRSLSLSGKRVIYDFGTLAARSKLANAMGWTCYRFWGISLIIRLKSETSLTRKTIYYVTRTSRRH